MLNLKSIEVNIRVQKHLSSTCFETHEISHCNFKMLHNRFCFNNKQIRIMQILNFWRENSLLKWNYLSLNLNFTQIINTIENILNLPWLKIPVQVTINSIIINITCSSYRDSVMKWNIFPRRVGVIGNQMDETLFGQKLPGISLPVILIWFIISDWSNPWYGGYVGRSDLWVSGDITFKKL